MLDPALLGLLSAVAIVALGCGASTEDLGSAAPGAPGSEVVCPSGHIVGPAGACMPVGIQGCAAQFIESDNLCHPSMAKCPPGTTPKLDEGCRPVGIPGCAPVFVGDDGLCHAATVTCPPGTLALPEEGCVPLDGPDGCGEGLWGSIPDEPGTVYVDAASNAAVPDGSRVRPVRTIEDALGLVASGGTIALAAGTYDEQVTIMTPLTLAGRCASMVRIQRSAVSDPQSSTVVVARVPDVTIRGLSIGGDGIGVLAEGAPRLVMDRVHIEGTTSAGLVVRGREASVSLSRSSIERTRVQADLAFGIVADAGATVAVSSSVLAGNAAAGVFARAGSVVTVTGSLIEEVPPPGGENNTGAGVASGSRLTLERSSVTAAPRGHAVVLVDPNSEGEVISSHLEGALDDTGGEPIGTGVLAAAGGAAVVRSSVVLGHETGVKSLDPGTRVTIEESLIRGWGAARPRAIGAGALSGGRLDLSSTAVSQRVGCGLVVYDGAVASAEGSLIEGTLAYDDTFASGVLNQSGSVSLRSTAVVASSQTGVLALAGGSLPTTLTLEETLVERTLPFLDTDRGGIGIETDDGVTGTIVSSAVLKSLGAGILVLASTDMRIEGSLVQDTAPDRASGEYGAAITADSSRLSVSSSVLRDNTMAGLMVILAQAADIRQVRIEGVKSGSFSLKDGTHVSGIGDGVLAVNSTGVDVSEVEATGCARAGVLYASSSGSISTTSAWQNRFGLVVQGSPQPSVDEVSAFERNTESDTVIGGDLPIPDRAVPIP